MTALALATKLFEGSLIELHHGQRERYYKDVLQGSATGELQREAGVAGG